MSSCKNSVVGKVGSVFSSFKNKLILKNYREVVTHKSVTRFRRTMAQLAGTPKNLLQYERSPYLLQHQSNPVEWYPWNSKTLEKAKSENKLIFLSVGYSTCHWCHVMERESFENPSIAKIMNTNFINIKMDREERPDIDRIYMTFVQAVSGSGGWPMSVWMTPELQPIFGGTYYPPEDRYFGRPGFRALLLTISEQWKENKDKCIESAAKIMEVMEKTAMLPSTETVADAKATPEKCVQQLTRSFEPSFGGFSESPKFPQPVNLLFLIDFAGRCSDERVKGNITKMVEKTLNGMAKGGIHDHVGMGFARYSTDKKWHVPHFEKMLYDQAQLTIAYSNCFLLTGNDFFATIVADILTYVDRDLSHKDGGICTAEDADSLSDFPASTASAASHAEKKEGAFYVWTKTDLQEILNKQASNGTTFSDIFSYRYGVKEKGNVDPYQDPHDELKNQNVLFEADTLEGTAKKFSLPLEEINNIIDECKISLFNYRNINRPRPGLDTKVITSWNSLMISGFAKAGRALKNSAYNERAEKAFAFLQKHTILSSMDVIRTCYINPETQDVEQLEIPVLGCVDDFSNLICASIELYQSTFNWKYIQIAEQLQAKQNELFQDVDTGGYFNSRLGDSSIIVRFKDDDDGAEPSANSTSLINLLRLNAVSAVDYTTAVIELLKQFSDRLAKIPITLPLMASVLPFVGTIKDCPGPLTILITGPNLKSSEFLGCINSKLLPIGSMIIGFDTSITPLNSLDNIGIHPQVKQICSSADTSQVQVHVRGSKDSQFVLATDLPHLEKLLQT